MCRLPPPDKAGGGWQRYLQGRSPSLSRAGGGQLTDNSGSQACNPKKQKKLFSPLGFKSLVAISSHRGAQLSIM